MAAPKKAQKKVPVKKKSSVKKTSAKKSTTKKSNEAQPVSPPEKKPAAKEVDGVLVLDAVMVINEVKALHEKLLTLSECKETVTIDVSKVEAIDTAVFQLLLAFVSTMNKKNVKIDWRDPSDEFIERAALMGLTDELYMGGAK